MEEINKKTDARMSQFENKHFDYMQLKEIRIGVKKNLDVNTYAKPEFLFLQMRQIRMGLEAGVDVTKYNKPGYDWLQMEEIRLGLMEGNDISMYAGLQYSATIMREIRKGLKEGINLNPFVKRGCSTSVLKQVRKARNQGIIIEKYVLEGYDSDQLKQIWRGLKDEIQIENYLDMQFSGSQMEQLRLGLKAEVDISKYKDYQYNWMQMQEIRMGLEKNLNVFWYTDVNFSARQMREIRLGLENGDNVVLFAHYKYSATDMRKLRTQNSYTDIPKLEEQTEGEIDLSQIENIPLEAFSDILVTVSPDEMTASVRVLNSASAGTYTAKDIRLRLEQQGIRQGIQKDRITEIIEQKLFDQDIVVAEGKEAIQGTDGFYKFHFKKELPKIPKILEDDSVDYQNVDFFENVEEGKVLVEYEYATNGIYGYNVKGKLIAPKKGKELPQLHGKGIELQDGYKYVSLINGRVEYLEYSNSLNVYPLYIYSGDLTMAVGNLKFKGDIIVQGYVGSGVVVEAEGDIVVNGNVEGAYLKAGKNILIRSGVSAGGRGSIEAGDKIFGKYFEEANLTAKGDVESNYLLNCNIVTMSKIIVSGRRGAIVGGISSAIQGIEAYNIGNQAEIRTFVEIGKTKLYKEQLMELENRKDELSREVDSLRITVVKYRTQYSHEELAQMSMYQSIERALLETTRNLQSVSLSVDSYINEMVNGGKPSMLRLDGFIYPGTTVKIDDSLMLVREKVPRVMFRLKGNRVAMFTNKR